MTSTIGKYRVLERIARGGMGTVFKAHDPTLDRLVAIKVISGDTDISDELKARFYREAQACARLSHPNIITVHELGDDQGRLFIVMELLEGEDLKRIIAQRADLSLEDKLSMMIQICDGLHYAHQKGVIHRDVKPGNIFRGRDGQLKVLDFGIARVVTTDSGLTSTGHILGTLRYMSPEQARGRVDHRSDIFSAGAVFYELLTYRRAFDADDPMELLELLRSEDPPPAAEIDPSIPRELSDTIAQAMQKHPAERFADLGEMRARLDRVRRTVAAEADRLRAAVRTRLDDARRLEAALADRLGSAPDTERPAPVDDRTGLTALRRIERELPRELGRLEARLARATELDPVLAEATRALASGEFEPALAGFERVLREIPDHRRAEDGLARLCERLEAAAGDAATTALAARARAALGRVGARRAGHAAFAGGEARLAAGDLPGAIARFSEALAADETHTDVAAALDRARAALAELQAHEAEVARRLSAVEAALAGHDDPEAAARAIERLAELAPDLPQLAVFRLRARRRREGPGRPAPEPTPAPAPRQTRRARRLAVAGAAIVLLAATGALVARRAELPWLSGSSARAAAERSRAAMLATREEATRSDPERLFPALWVAALERELAAESGVARGAFAEAEARFAEARDSYARIAKEAGDLRVLSRREAEARGVEGLAVNARRAAELADADKFAPRVWAGAVDRQRQAESAARAEQFDRAQTLWREAGEAYRQAERDARESQALAGRAERERQDLEARARQAAQDLEEAAREARRAAAQAGAAQHAGAAMAAAQQKETEARQLADRRDFPRAARLLLEAQAQYRRAASEAERQAALERERPAVEQARTEMAQARDAADTAGARRLVGPLVAAAESKDRDGQAAFGRQDYPQARRLFQDAQADYRRAAEEARRVAAIEGERARTSEARAQMAEARSQAEQAGARRAPGSPFPAAEAKERDGQAALGRGELARAQQLFREAQVEYQKAVTEAERLAALERERPPAEQARALMAQAREAADRADAKRLAAPLHAAAEGKERDGQAAFGRQEYPRARQLFQDAQAEYQKAAQEGQRVAAIERDRQGADQARTLAAQARTEAEKAEARQHAAPLWASAGAKEADAQRAVEARQYAAARARFQEAQADYQRAAEEARKVVAASRVPTAPPKAASPAPAIPAPLPAPPPPAVARQDPQADVRSALEQYRRAVETKDLALLQQVRPGLSSNELRQVRAAFDNTRQHRIELEIQAIEVSGDLATVKGRRRDSFESGQGQLYRNEALFTYQLRRRADRWVIDSLR
jgi:hypothetical protein